MEIEKIQQDLRPKLLRLLEDQSRFAEHFYNQLLQHFKDFKGQVLRASDYLMKMKNEPISIYAKVRIRTRADQVCSLLRAFFLFFILSFTNFVRQ